jgi:hypothetical protein
VYRSYILVLQTLARFLVCASHPPSYSGQAAPNPELYTGHCFRRSSASLLAKSGADLFMLKRHGAWRSNAVVESYVEESIENKRKTAVRILGESTSTNIGMDTSVRIVQASASTNIVMDSRLAQFIDNDEDKVSNKEMVTGIYKQ